MFCLAAAQDPSLTLLFRPLGDIEMTRGILAQIEPTLERLRSMALVLSSLREHRDRRILRGPLTMDYIHFPAKSQFGE